jgi:thiamine kinase-like enzyme
MPRSAITGVDQLNAAYFNRVLAGSGALETGGVAGFEAEAQESACSTIAHIELRYTPGATGRLPARLFLKLCGGDGEEFGPSEVEYYARDYTGLEGAPIPTCYDAVYSAEQARYHLLMEDLSATHHNSRQFVPTEAYGGAVAEAMARLHAHWWGKARLQAGGHPLPGPREIERYVEHVRPGLLPMLQCVDEELDAPGREALVELFEKHPPLLRERARESETLTLVHGDPNPGNILAPIDGVRPVYLIDRQPFDWSLTTWLGVSDVAYMMVHWWDTEVRRRLELPVLRRYHAALKQHGIDGYSWEQLWRDYRLTAVQSLYVATEWCRLEEDRTKMRWVWLPQLKKAMAAFSDLGCRALWEA